MPRIMKNIAITCFVLIAVCVGLQAKKVVKAPYFMATNTSQIEFEKVTLGKDTTWIDAKIYSMIMISGKNKHATKLNPYPVTNKTAKITIKLNSIFTKQLVT